MAAPHLDSASFPRLHSGQGKPSDGTVTGTGLSKGFPVHIQSRHGNRKWAGTVGDLSSGTTWKATVSRANFHERDSIRDLDTVAVTVSNGPDTSNPVDTPSEIIP
jgi:hypothetical protein